MMLAPFATRPSTMALPATLASMTVAMAVAFVAFGMSGRDLRTVGLYLLLSRRPSVVVKKHVNYCCCNYGFVEFSIVEGIAAVSQHCDLLLVNIL